jgi:site-specific recombinase XerD
MTQNRYTLSPHFLQMKSEMELRGFSPQTMRHYLTHLRLLEKHFAKPAPFISPDELKEYLHHRVQSTISYSNVNISCNAFKLFFNKVLQRNWSDDVIVRPKRLKKFPCVLSREEILSIIDQVGYLKHKAILLTTYSSGLRISETLNLRVSDIDSKQMLIRVNQGKGGKDRFTILSQSPLPQRQTRGAFDGLLGMRKCSGFLQFLPQPPLPQVSACRPGRLGSEAVSQAAASGLFPCGVYGSA